MNLVESQKCVLMKLHLHQMDHLLYVLVVMQLGIFRYVRDMNRTRKVGDFGKCSTGGSARAGDTRQGGEIGDLIPAFHDRFVSFML